MRLLKKITLSLFLIPFIVAAQPQLIEKVVSTPDTPRIAYEKWKLSNGLTIIVHEDHSNPIAHVRVTYHVGSSRESIGKSGFAHFFEHMMFEGSDNVRDKEHFKIVNESGGNMNGYTQRDATTYFETMPSNNLEVALWLEADRMGFLLDSVTKEKFEIQRATVKNEKGQNVENQPYAMAFVETINQILYPPGHPYSWPTIGYVDDLDRVTVDDLKNFFLRWYGPNNALLTVVGDVNTKDVIALADKYFGPINPCPEVKKMKAQPPLLDADKYASYNDNIYLPLTLMVFPTVPRYHRDEASLELLADMMGSGNNSVFYKNFVKPEKAIAADISYQGEELSGEFQIQVVAFPSMGFAELDKDFNETEKLIRSTIDEFGTSGINDEALQRAKAKMESGIVDGVETSFGKASYLADWSIFSGRSFNLNDELDRYNKVTKEDITRVYNKYIKGKNAAIVNVYPKNPDSKDSVKSVNPYANMKPTDAAEFANLKYVKAKDNFDRSKRPQAATPKSPTVPTYFSKKFNNGLSVIGTRSQQAPKVVMLLTIDGGNLVNSEDPKKVGLSELTSAMMNEGTKNYTTEQISAELDKLGSDISFDGGKMSTTVTVRCLTKNLDATLKILEEKLMRPRFDAEDFKRIKKQYVESLVSERKQAESTANKLFYQVMYGENIMGAYVSDKNVKKFTLEEVKAYYENYYSPSVSKLVIVGDVDEKDILPKLAFLEQWKGKEVKLPEINVSAVAGQPTQIYLSHKENAPQSVVMIGHAGMKYDATGDYFRANAMNFSFGGAFNSRLNLNLREAKGYTYGIRSGFSGNKYTGEFMISSSVKRSATDTSIAEIMKEWKSFREKGMSEEEMNFTKNSILNGEALRYESPFQKATFLSRIIQYNLPSDYTNQQQKILKEMTLSEMNGLAQKDFHPESAIILVVGNKYVLKDRLEKLGYGKVKEISLDGSGAY
ncbi:MAG: M16 family metallopeptidase [Bacteroidota bacterium]